MKAMHIVASATALALLGCGSQVKVETEEEKDFYALGMLVAEGLGPFKGQLTPEELEAVVRGVEDVARNREPAVDLSEYLPKVGALSEQFRIRGEQEFLAATAAEEGAVVLPSGVVYQELVAGPGEEIGRRDWVTIHFHGTLVGGTVFDSTVERDKPEKVPLSQMMPGLTKGIRQMKVGGKGRIVIPPSQGYGRKKAGSIPPNSVLVYEVEVLSTERMPWSIQE
jgi:FKBP-type peptidyl-prolyl cis-trans isomerase